MSTGNLDPAADVHLGKMGFRETRPEVGVEAREPTLDWHAFAERFRAIEGNVEKVVQQLLEARIDVSIFVDPDLEQIRQCHKLRAPKVEINTGKYADAWKTGNWTAELDKLATAARAARKLGLVVLAGHGLTYRNIDGIATIPEIEELNIGHSIISRASLVGLDAAVREMAALIRAPRRLPTVR